jgi:hypothetical protein
LYLGRHLPFYYIFLPNRGDPFIMELQGSVKFFLIGPGSRVWRG